MILKNKEFISLLRDASMGDEKAKAIVNSKINGLIDSGEMSKELRDRMLRLWGVPAANSGFQAAADIQLKEIEEYESRSSSARA